MKIRSLYFFVVALLMLVSCSSPTVPIDNAISLTTSENQLKIKNHSSQIVYLFVVEQESAAYIDWAPHFTDPKVAKENSLRINYSEIINGSKDPVKSGDNVIVYYWTASDKITPEVFSKVIKL